jgi:hypothetical protein
MFVVAAGWPSAGRADVVSPFRGLNLITGSSHTIVWEPVTSCATVDIELYQGLTFVDEIASGTSNDGSFAWQIPDYGLDPACNFAVRIGCDGEVVSSQAFSIDGLTLAEAIEGDRTVTLHWRRSNGDTLGASNIRIPDLQTGDRVFGGYNVWRLTYDNLLNPITRERFSKIRAYDVAVPRDEELASRYDFDSEFVPYGEVIRQIDEETEITEIWQLAQTFVSPPGGADVCQVRIYLGDVAGRWNTTLSITPLAGGLPDLDAPLGSLEVGHGTGGAESGQSWLTFVFPTPIPLAGDQSYALVVAGDPEVRPATVTWTSSLYDAYPAGETFATRDDGGTWESAARREGDFSFVIATNQAGLCTDWEGQRFGGESFRRFNDPESIRAFVFVPPDEGTGGGDQDDVPEQTELSPSGPFNGFQVRYAVTAFDRVKLGSSNVEFISSCEDTLVDESGFPDGIQPDPATVWPDVLFPRSDAKSTVSLLSDVYPVPNPYVRDPNSPSYPRWELPGQWRIQFVNLPTNATIKIFTLAGDNVRQLEHREDHGTENWDLRNDSGELVDAGVYLWLVKTPSGERKTGQLVIVR